MTIMRIYLCCLFIIYFFSNFFVTVEIFSFGFTIPNKTCKYKFSTWNSQLLGHWQRQKNSVSSSLVFPINLFLSNLSGTENQGLRSSSTSIFLKDYQSFDFDEDLRVIVVGSNGYLGMELVQQLIHSGTFVYGVVRDTNTFTNQIKPVIDDIREKSELVSKKEKKIGSFEPIYFDFDKIRENGNLFESSEYNDEICNLKEALSKSKILFNASGPFRRDFRDSDLEIVEPTLRTSKVLMDLIELLIKEEKVHSRGDSLNQDYKEKRTLKNQLEIIIHTSSSAALRGPTDNPFPSAQLFNHRNWNKSSQRYGKGMEPYQWAKVEQERYLEKRTAELNLSFVSFLPTFMIGYSPCRKQDSISRNYMRRWYDWMKDKKKRVIYDTHNIDEVNGRINKNNNASRANNLLNNKNIHIGKESKLMIDVRDVATIEIEVAMKFLKGIRALPKNEISENLSNEEDKYRYNDRFILSSTERRITSEQIELYLMKEYKLVLTSENEELLDVYKEDFRQMKEIKPNTKATLYKQERKEIECIERLKALNLSTPLYSFEESFRYAFSEYEKMY